MGRKLAQSFLVDWLWVFGEGRVKTTVTKLLTVSCYPEILALYHALLPSVSQSTRLTPPPHPFPPPRFTGRRVQRLSGSTRPFRPWFPQFSQPTPPGPNCLLPQLGFHGPSLASVPRVLLSSLTPLPLSAPHPHLGSWTWLERGARLPGSGRPAWKPCAPLACCLSPLRATLHLFSSPPSSRASADDFASWKQNQLEESAPRCPPASVQAA